MTNWYLLNEREARSGPENMAVDQILLELVDEGRLDVPVLRFYAWSRPTLSLGYHQRWQDTVDQAALERYGVDLVRRWTGGRGVLHEPDEITYAVVAPLVPPFTSRVTHNYRLIGTALERFTLLEGARGQMAKTREDAASVRAQRGLPCFASLSESEIESGGQKLIGSAQKLSKRGFLQHGSIPMVHRHKVLHEITGSTRDVSETMTGVADFYRAAGLALPDRAQLIAGLAESFEAVFAMRLEPLPSNLLDPDKIALLARETFAKDSWTFRK